MHEPLQGAFVQAVWRTTRGDDVLECLQTLPEQGSEGWLTIQADHTGLSCPILWEKRVLLGFAPVCSGCFSAEMRWVWDELRWCVSSLWVPLFLLAVRCQTLYIVDECWAYLNCLMYGFIMLYEGSGRFRHVSTCLDITAFSTVWHLRFLPRHQVMMRTRMLLLSRTIMPAWRFKHEISWDAAWILLISLHPFAPFAPAGSQRSLKHYQSLSSIIKHFDFLEANVVCGWFDFQRFFDWTVWWCAPPPPPFFGNLILQEHSPATFGFRMIYSEVPYGDPRNGKH